MTSFIFAILLLGLATSGVVARKTYYYVPARELKRQAAAGDRTAEQLYAAVAYGRSLRALLWLLIGLCSAGGIVLLAESAPGWLSIVTVLILLWIAFHWLPASQASRTGTQLTLVISPAVVWILARTYPLLHRTAGIIERRYTALPHTGLFEREDVLHLVEQQKKQTDSRLSQEELEIISRALTFDEQLVGDNMVSGKDATYVLASDTVGPVLIDELHKSGQQYALVREKPKGDFVGTMEITRLGLQSSGKVQDLMHAGVYYLHESDSLRDALHAFYLTNCPVFVVTNSFEEFAGVITMDNVLKQLLGHIPGDNFDQYADIGAVAARHPQRENGSAAVKTDDEVLE